MQGTASLIPPEAMNLAISRLPLPPPEEPKTIFCFDSITNPLRAGVEPYSSLYLRTCLIRLELVLSKQGFPNTWMEAGRVSEKPQLTASLGQNDGLSGSQTVASPVRAGPPCCFQHNWTAQRSRWEGTPCAPGPAVPSLCQSPGEQEGKAVPWSCMPGRLPFPEGPGLFPRGPLGLQCAGACARRWWPGWGWHCFPAGASPCLCGQCERHSEVGSGHPGTRREDKKNGTTLRLPNPNLHCTKEEDNAQRG